MVQEIVKKNEKGKAEVIGRKILIGGKEVRLKFTHQSVGPSPLP